MKFTSVAVAALLGTASAVKLNDACGKNDTWCNKGLPYDYDQPTLAAAQAENARTTQSYNAAKDALQVATLAHAAALAADNAATATDLSANQARSGAFATLEGSDYKDRSTYSGDEASWNGSLKAREGTWDAKLKADDNLVAKTLFMERKQQDFDAWAAKKAASDANLAANEDRWAFEQDQLWRGMNQDRIKFAAEDHANAKAVINVAHDERAYSNSRLMKLVA